MRTDTVVYRDCGSTSARTCRRPPRAPRSSSPFDLPNTLQTALNALYSHYEGEFERWQRAGIGVPPVFIVVCQNTAISKLVFEWIAGFERGDAEEGERAAFMPAISSCSATTTNTGGRLPARARC